ncbi:MAG: hypothetical protein IJP80_00810 [Bacteroidales bacterium]|nr:hypothetical protein [Bacteroidales bacterium]
MKPLKQTMLLAMLALLLSTSAQAIKIPDTRISFSFPDGGWKYLNTNKVNKDITVYLYSYSKKAVVDNNGDTIIPFMRIYVQKNYSGTVFDMAFNRFNSQPFQAIEEYPFRDGLGYWGGYSSDNDGKDYFFQMVYLKDNSNAIEIRLETTSDTYEAFEKEFKAILNTIKLK